MKFRRLQRRALHRVANPMPVLIVTQAPDTRLHVIAALQVAVSFVTQHLLHSGALHTVTVHTTEKLGPHFMSGGHGMRVWVIISALVQVVDQRAVFTMASKSLCDVILQWLVRDMVGAIS